MTKKNPENVSPAKLKAIWQQISPADWLSLLQEYRPEHRWTLAGSQIKGLCIYHTDTSPSLILNLDKGYAHCFGGTCRKHEWNPVQFVAKAAKVGYGTALRKLKSRFGIKLPSAYLQNVQQIEDNNDLKRVLQRVLNMELVEVLQKSDASEFAYAEKAGLLSWLRKRNFPEDAAHMWPVGILPPRERLYARLSETKALQKFREPALKYLEQYLATPGSPQIHEGSLVFFFYTSPTTIGRLRIRHPASKDFYAVSDPFDEAVGVFGLNMYTHLLGDTVGRPLLGVEGEMDALSIISHQVSQGLDNICVIATGGTMESALDPLLEYGFSEAFLAPDNDPEGAGWARELLARNKQVSRVFRWADTDGSRQIKDVDEAIRAYGFDDFYARLCDLDNFARNADWIAEQFENDLSKIDPKNLEARTEKAAEWGRGLKADAERNAFVESVCTLHGIDRELLLQEMIPDDDSPEAFIKRLAHRLKSKEYHFLKEKQVGTSTLFSAWSNRKRIMRTFPMNSKSGVQAALEADLGRLDEYIRQELGEPPFLSFKLNAKGQPIALPVNIKSQLVSHCFHQAVAEVISSITPDDRLTELGQGVHYVTDFGEDGSPAVLVVNGSHFFKGQLSPDKKEIQYTELVSPIAGQFFFKLQSQPWSAHVKTVRDIESGMDIDPRFIYDALKKILNLGWRFKHNELESAFLAADIMYTPIATVFQHMLLVDISGESHSGKTTLMQVIAGNEFPDLRLCEATALIDDFSAAAIRQSMTGHRLRLFLDEFEDADIGGIGRIDKRSSAVRDVLEIFRTITSGSTSVRGTSAGEAIKYHLYFPATVGGIFTMREARDLNRYVHIKTQFIEGFRDPVDPIREKFTTDELTAIRRGVTLCLLPRIPELLQAYQEVKQEFSQSTGSMSRLKENFLPAVAIMKLAGLDYAKFLDGFSKIKMEELQEQGGTKKESATIWDHILHTQLNLNQYGIEDIGGISSLAKLLSDKNTRYALRGADLGAYFIEDNNRKWLVVFWHKAVSGILRNSNMYRNSQYSGRLKIVADADPRVIPKEKLKRSNFLKKEVWPRVGARISYEEISVIDLSGTLQAMDSSEEDAEADATARSKLMGDIPDVVVDPKPNRGNFEV